MGNILIVFRDNVERNKWPLAVVTEVYPGNDGKVHSAMVKTAEMNLVRPITKLFAGSS